MGIIGFDMRIKKGKFLGSAGRNKGKILSIIGSSLKLILLNGALCSAPFLVLTIQEKSDFSDDHHPI